MPDTTPAQAPEPPNTYKTTGTVLDANQKEGMDVEEIFNMLQMAEDYIEQTRADFETSGPQKWISDTATAVSAALDAVHKLDMAHEDDKVDWTDDDGFKHKILVRLQDPELFDEALQAYRNAEELYEQYFTKHLELLHNK